MVNESFFGSLYKKRGQYKIQQMAFMILAIFFFFVLVGIFFIGWQITGLKSDFSKLQEEKALSALKVIAGSTELNCEQSEDWCIDKDKLVAYAENSYLYEDFWSAASIEVLMVYPRGNTRERVAVSSNSSGGSSSSNPNVQFSSGRSGGGASTGGGGVSDDEGFEDFVTYGGDPIKCPGPNCDFYVLYDNGQKYKQNQTHPSFD